MKKIQCEMCGSNDIIKNNGYYICQSCGCKYTLDEAKKLFVEGVVKIDSSEKTKNYIQLAKSSLKSEEYKKCLDYCNDVLENEPDNKEIIKLKALSYIKMWGTEKAFSTLKSISLDSVLNDEVIELLFEFLNENKKEFKRMFDYENAVQKFCEGEKLQISDKALLIETYRCIIRSCLYRIEELSYEERFCSVLAEYSSTFEEYKDKVKALDSTYDYKKDLQIVYERELTEQCSKMLNDLDEIELSQDIWKTKRFVEEEFTELRNLLDKIKRDFPQFPIDAKTKQDITRIKDAIPNFEKKINDNLKNAKRQKKNTIISCLIIAIIIGLVITFIITFILPVSFPIAALIVFGSMLAIYIRYKID